MRGTATWNSWSRNISSPRAQSGGGAADDNSRHRLPKDVLVPVLRQGAFVPRCGISAVRHADRGLTAHGELIDFVKERSSSMCGITKSLWPGACARATAVQAGRDTLDCGEDRLRQYVEQLGPDRYFGAGRERQANPASTSTDIGYTACRPIWKPSACFAVIGHPQKHAYVRRVQ